MPHYQVPSEPDDHNGATEDMFKREAAFPEHYHKFNGGDELAEELLSGRFFIAPLVGDSGEHLAEWRHFHHQVDSGYGLQHFE